LKNVEVRFLTFFRKSGNFPEKIGKSENSINDKFDSSFPYRGKFAFKHIFRLENYRSDFVQLWG